MKKLMSVVLMLLLLTSFMAGAFAEDTVEYPLPDVGLTLYMPTEILTGEGSAGGSVEVLVAEELGYQSGVYLTMFIYEPDPDVFNAENYAPYLTFLCLKSGYDESVANDPELAEMIPGDMLYELATVGDYTHYASIGADTLPAGFSQANIDEYNYFLSMAEDIISSGDYYEPQDPYAEVIGSEISFQATDLDGNPVDSASLFANNEITMLNIWETGCGPCKGELPELAKIHTQLQSMGCGIVGLLWDSFTQDNIDTAKALLQSAGATYPSIQCPDNFDELFDISGFPATYFIDRNGNILGSPVFGAMVDKYIPAIQDLLSGDSSASAMPSGNPFTVQAGAIKLSGGKAAPSDDNSNYRILCVDENGNPVAGAAVQFCSDSMCQIAKTDADGVAEFGNVPGHYVVHLLKPPAGYAADNAEYEVPAFGGEVTIVLKAA